MGAKWVRAMAQLDLEIEAEVTPVRPGVAARNKLEQITCDADQKIAEAQVEVSFRLKVCVQVFVI